MAALNAARHGGTLTEPSLADRAGVFQRAQEAFERYADLIQAPPGSDEQELWTSVERAAGELARVRGDGPAEAAVFDEFVTTNVDLIARVVEGGAERCPELRNTL